MKARDLTRDGLIRALRPAVAASPAVDTALRARGEAIAARAEEAGMAARVVRRGAGLHAVEMSGPGLFARAYGSREAPADDAIGAAVAVSRRDGG